MVTLYADDFNELQSYKWDNDGKRNELIIEEGEYITIEVFKNEELIDMNVLSDFNFDNLDDDLSFTIKHGLKIVMNNKYVKLKYKVKYVISEIIKRKEECSKNKDKKWVYDRHALYEFAVKEECLSDTESLLSILNID